MNEDHTYKGGQLPEDKDDGESLTRKPKPKRPRAEKEFCGCKSEKACSTGHCSCKNSGKKCNDKCINCKDKCNNKM